MIYTFNTKGPKGMQVRTYMSESLKVSDILQIGDRIRDFLSGSRDSWEVKFVQQSVVDDKLLITIFYDQKKWWKIL